MSWLFSRALVEEYWRADSSDGAQSALLNASPTPQAYLSPGKMTAYSSPSLSGMTFAPLTDVLGEGLLMSFLADFPVRISARQGKNMGLRGNDLDCGKSLCGWFAKYDLNTCSWKTPQLLLFGGSMSFSVIWPEWGMMRNGVCSERIPLEPRKYVRGSGLLPALVATDYKGATPLQVARRERKGNGWTLREWLAKYSRGSGTVYPNPGFLEKMMGWPPGWTELKPLGTVRYRNVRHLRSK